MADRSRRVRSVILRAFLIYSVLYTLTSVLFDHWGTKYTGLSEAACAPQFIGMPSDESFRQRLIDQFAPTLVFSLGEPVRPGKRGDRPLSDRAR